MKDGGIQGQWMKGLGIQGHSSVEGYGWCPWKMEVWECTPFQKLNSFVCMIASIASNFVVVTFRVSHRRREMYIGHLNLSVSVCICVSVPRRIPTLLHGCRCNFGEW